MTGPAGCAGLPAPTVCGRAARGLRRLAVVLALTAPGLPAHAAATLQGRVVAVADGDSLVLLDTARRRREVRLAGIDAPEKGQPYADRARQSLRGLVLRREVTLSWHKVDRYGRLVGTLRSHLGDVGLEQLRRGLAWHYVHYAGEQSGAERAAYAAAERAARDRRLGLWADPAPVAPWDHRRRARAEPAQRSGP